MHFFSLQKFLKKENNTEKGFSVVELIFVISIFAILAGVTFFNFTDFSNNITLNNLAHDIALSIRQAQVYGASASQSNSFAGGSQTRGLFIEYDANQNAFTNSLVLFSDASIIGQFEGSPPDTVIRRDRIQEGGFIAEICFGQDATNLSCSGTSMHITFTRPRPEASIVVNGTSYGHGAITVATNDGEERRVHISSIGQIYVE